MLAVYLTGKMCLFGLAHRKLYLNSLISSECTSLFAQKQYIYFIQGGPDMFHNLLTYNLNKQFPVSKGTELP